jgi:glycerol dehydrogenase-like iron-containing ADH family enzyme
MAPAAMWMVSLVNLPPFIHVEKVAFGMFTLLVLERRLQFEIEEIYRYL